MSADVQDTSLHFETGSELHIVPHCMLINDLPFQLSLHCKLRTKFNVKGDTRANIEKELCCLVGCKHCAIQSMPQQINSVFCHHEPALAVFILILSVILSVSFSQGQIACFPSSEGEKLLNMEEEKWNWHQHDIRLTQASLKSPFSPPLLVLPAFFTSLPHVKHMVGGCLKACTRAPST